MKKVVLALGASILANHATAMDPMPPEAGFSGIVNVGAAGGAVESNFLAEIVGVDLSNDTIYSYDSPSETTIIIPTFNFNIGYTFADKKTRLSAATAVESSIDFSTNTAVALRHEFDSLGGVELAALLPGATAVKVWEDPYLTGQKRRSTEDTSSGGRLTWDRIVGSNFELIANVRSIDVEDERSGQSSGLSASQRQLLDREGDVTRIELGYMFNCSDDNLSVRPSVAYIDRDLDGEAMAQDGYELSVEMLYNAGAYQWLNRATYQSLDGDKENPIFDQVNDANLYLLASEVRIPRPFGWDKWTSAVGVSWAENDADIDFNKSFVWMFSARLGRNF